MWLLRSLLLYLATQVLSNGIKFDVSEGECTIAQKLKSEVIYRYFESQHTVTFIDLSEDPNPFACSGGNRMVPVQVYRSLASVIFGPQITSSSVTSLPTFQGYFLKGTFAEISQHLLPKLGAYNPKARVLIRIFDLRTQDELKEIVAVAFKKHKILNAVIVILNNETTSLGTFCFYNPFKQSASVDCVALSVKNLNLRLDRLNMLLLTRIENLQKYPLKVHLYAQEIFSKPVYDNSRKLVKFDYIDGALPEAFAEKLNFTQLFVNDPFETTDGFVAPNGSFSGSLAMLEREEVDYVGNARLISNFETNKSVFLTPLTMAKYNFVIRRRERTRQLMTFPFEIYERSTTVVSLVLTALFPVIFHVVKIGESRMMSTKRNSFSTSCLYVTALQWNVSVQLSRVTSVRIITITIVFYALIATSLMQGRTVEKLNSSQNYDAIDTIEGLIKNGYQLVVSHILADVLKKQNGDNTREMWRNVPLRSVQANEGPNVILKNKKLAFLMPKRHCGHYLDQFYDHTTGENLFEVIAESAFEFYVAPLVPKASPFIEKFNDIILRFVEGGLDGYHLDVAETDKRVIWYQRVRNGSTPKPPRLDLKLVELFPAFKLYGILISICVLSFTCEKLHWCLTKKIVLTDCLDIMTN